MLQPLPLLGRQQASVFGYACDHTEDLMPLPIWLAHRLAHRIDVVQTVNKLPYLLPDAEIQVGFDFQNGNPARLQGITLVATQHQDSDVEQLRFRRHERHAGISEGLTSPT